MFNNIGLLRRLLPYLRPRRGRALAVVSLTVVGALLSLAIPWPLALLVDSILGDKPWPAWLGAVGSWSTTSRILFAVGLGVALVALQSAVSVVKQWVETRLELDMVLDFRSDLFAHIQRLPWNYHDQGMAGRFIYQTNHIAHEAGTTITSMVPLGEAALMLVGMFVITYRLGPGLAVAGLVVLPFLVGAMRYYGRRIEPELLRVRELEGDSMAIVHEKLSIIKVVNSFVRERYEHARFRTQAQLGVDQRVRVTVRQTIFSLGIALLMAIGTAVVLAVGARAVIRGELTVGQLLVVVAYLAAVYAPLETISSTLAGLQQQLLQLRVVFDVLDTPITITDRPGATPRDRVDGRIELDHVCFSHAGRVDTIDDVSLVIEPGTRLAIVGATGAGKSTLAALVPRYYDVDGGAVRIDGVDVRDLPVGWLRDQVAVVMQEPVLFAGTIAENIQYGRLDASWQDVVAAARDAGAHDFIEALPQGYATRIGERGARLSGGERQRIAIARAFLKDAPILILDEPTSAIDTRTEATILDALDRLAAGRTTIVIAHRLSTIRTADRIVVLEQGRVAEQGTHEELLDLGGRYAELWAGQGHVPTGVRSAARRPRAAVPARRPRVVVLGSMTKMPVAGVVWQTMHYLVGLEQCGCEAWYVEAHGRTPSMLMESEGDDGALRAATFIDATLRRFGLAGRWAFHALHADGTVHGMSREELGRLYDSADLIINLHGGTVPREEFARTNRLIYVETDPVQLQVELEAGDAATLEFLAPHVELFTFGENLGRPDCGVPNPLAHHFHPTRQPVVLDWWRDRDRGGGRAFTTIGNWRQAWRDVELGGERYGWSKDAEWERILHLPQRRSVPFELALSSISGTDVERLRDLGWGVVPGLAVSTGIDAYRRYITSSIGELTVAKDQNVRLRSGWFSDRSATYLAAGRPVITQDTGFEVALPTGCGLFAFSDLDEAAAAVDEVLADLRRHRAGALEIAREMFDARRVLGDILAQCGISTSGGHIVDRRPDAFPPETPVNAVSRHPTRLAAATTAHVLGAALLPPGEERDARPGLPRTSIVVVTHNHLEVTRLCLESLLVNTDLAGVEVIVVDNASEDLTPAYLAELASAHSEVEPVLLEENHGFAAAVNLGLQRARGEILVILNNDVVLPSPWLRGLERHLEDPAVGLVGPVSPGAPNEARVAATYTSYDDLCAHADRLAFTHRGRWSDVPMLAMFCVALRREVWERVGPLDEGFGLGLFEDDDYALRVRAAGWTLRCAHDVLVHHIGEASFGDLVSGGQHGELFRRNRERFESKWGTRWSTHGRAPDAAYDRLVESLRATVASIVPDEHTVLVVSKGDRALLDVPGRTLQHFPQSPDGSFAGHHPGSTDEILAELEQLTDRGATYLLIPAPALWWLDHYDGLSQALTEHYELCSEQGGRLYRLREPVTAGVSA